MRRVSSAASRSSTAVGLLLAGVVLSQQASWGSEPGYLFQEAMREGRKTVAMEAEHYTALGTGRVACVAHASGGRILYSPDEVREHKEQLVASYRFNIETPGRWYIRLRTFAAHHMQNGLFLAVDGKRLRHAHAETSRDSVVRTGAVLLSKGGWAWDNRWQHVDPPSPVFVDIEQPGDHTLSIHRREVMTYYDKILLIHGDDWSPYKTAPGPDETIVSAGTDWLGPLSYALHGVEDFPHAGSGFKRIGPERKPRSQHLILAEGLDRASVATPFPGTTGQYEIRLEYLADEHNRVEYRIHAGGRLVATHRTGPGEASPDDEPRNHYARGVTLESGQSIQVEAIAEDGCRARWRRLFLYGTAPGGPTTPRTDSK